MRLKHIALLSTVALSLAACGSKTETSTAPDNMAIDVGANDAMSEAAPAVASPLTNGQAFVNAAASSDAFEIETSKLAATNAKSSAVKAFATQMIKAHTESTAKLKATLAGVTPTITPDPTLTAEQQSKLAALSTKMGADFDTAYAADQTAGHQMTLDTLRGYAATGDVPALKTFATGLAPTVAAHLNMAKGLKL